MDEVQQEESRLHRHQKFDSPLPPRDLNGGDGGTRKVESQDREQRPDGGFPEERQQGTAKDAAYKEERNQVTKLHGDDTELQGKHRPESIRKVVRDNETKLG